MLLSLWWFIASLAFLLCPRIRASWCPSDIPVGDKKLVWLVKWSHYWRMAFLCCILFESIWLLILKRYLKVVDYSNQCITNRVTVIVFCIALVIKFMYDYFRCEALFDIIPRRKNFKTIWRLVQLYGLLANISIISWTAVVQYLYKNSVTSEGYCTLLYFGHNVLVQNTIYIWSFYILLNELSTLLLFLYPLWFMFLECQEGFLTRYEDLKKIKHIAIWAVLLSTPVPLFLSIWLLSHGQNYWSTYNKNTHLPLLLVFGGLFQYISMCLKYNYWISMFVPCVLICKKSVSEAGYIQLQGEGRDIFIRNELANSPTPISWLMLKPQYSEAVQTAQNMGLQSLTTDPPEKPDSLKNKILITNTQFSSPKCASTDLESVASTPHILKTVSHSVEEKSDDRTKLFHRHRRSSEYIRELMISSSNRPVTFSMAMTDERHIKRMTYTKERDECTKVELRGVTFKWFINWARLNMKVLKDRDDLKKVRTRDLILREVEVRTKKSETKPLWLQIPVEETGIPDIFVSHAWDMELPDLIEALREWRRAHFDKLWGTCSWLPKKMRRSREPFLWLDFLALPQPGIGASAGQSVACINIEEALCTTIQGIGKVVLCSDLNFKPLERSWCLYELAIAKKLKVNYYLAISKFFGQSEARARAKRVNIANAQCKNPKDKDRIDQLILKEFDGDFKNLHKQIMDIFTPQIHEWRAGIAGIWKLPAQS